MDILITGASGMIGSALARVISEDDSYTVIGTGRRPVSELKDLGKARYIQFPDVSIEANTEKLLNEFKPKVVINCAGITKHYAEGNQPLPAIRVNSMLPHLLVKHCDRIGAKLIQISSDCVFSGTTGNYLDTDSPDAIDIYGKTKALGEVNEGPHLTLRTSTIGHENQTAVGLLEWFLKQSSCNGYSKAIFSGLPTVEFGRLIRDYVLKMPSLHGLYNVGAKPISKLDLLSTISDVYGHNIELSKNESFVMNRSLNSDKFSTATNYEAPNWRRLVELMYSDYIGRD